MKTSEELQKIMDYATGTEKYTRFNVGIAEVLLTDGVVAFIENADAFWFVSDVLSYIPSIRKKAPDEYLFSVVLNVAKGKGNLTITDGDNIPVASKHYAYTDCPDGEWCFYYDSDSNVLMYCKEY